MFGKRNTKIAVILVLLFGGILFYTETSGFQAFTAETARVHQLKEDQPKFPDVTLQDSKGRVYSFDQLSGKYVLATFIYTSCGTVCPMIEMNMSQVYGMLPKQYMGKDIVFLSLSFDPDRDTPATLDEYGHHFGSDGEAWRMAVVPDKAELATLLQKFGVIVIPDGRGNYAHNAAFYLIDPQGRLVDVLDYKDANATARQLTGILQNGKGV
jgi:protein SCO1/2